MQPGLTANAKGESVMNEYVIKDVIYSLELLCFVYIWMTGRFGLLVSINIEIKIS